MAIGRCVDEVREHLGLGWAFAEVLARDAVHAEAVFREALAEACANAPTAASPRQRLLAAIHVVHYRRSHRPSHDGFGAGGVAGMSGALGRAVDGLPDEDRELLFLRFGADLDVAEVGRISGRPPAVARARILELCTALQSGLASAGSLPGGGAARDHRPPSRIH